MIPDYHIHTKLCKHASGEMEEYVQVAISKGISEIAFTDHIPLPDNFDLAHRMSENETVYYFEEIERLREKYKEINIIRGIEADFYDGFEKYIEDFIDKYAVELVLLSVHFIRDWPENNWAFSYYFPDRPLSQVYSDYLQAILRGIKTGLFDVVSHLDLIKSPDYPILSTNKDEVAAILGEAKQQNMAIELNTSGLRKDINEMYPDYQLLPMLNDTGNEIVFGSDAHKPEQVGFYFSELEEIVKSYPNLRIRKFRRAEKSR